eukprot:2232709-Pleurochrysis_carterae.AAC.1
MAVGAAAGAGVGLARIACGVISASSSPSSAYETRSMSRRAGGLTRISPAARSSRGVRTLDSSRLRSTSAKYCGGKDDDDSGGSC